MNNNSNYNPQIHHRKSIRLQGYDYSQAGLYFITICSHLKECLFGEVLNDEMILNDAGKIANECWLDIPNHFPKAILHEYCVMPNHLHGIIELTEHTQQPNNIHPPHAGAENVGVDDLRVENFQTIQNAYQKIIPLSIGSIVKGFKIGVTKWCRNNADIGLVWQRNYHEHIIRNQQSYQLITDYIINNPANWNKDKFYTTIRRG